MKVKDYLYARWNMRYSAPIFTQLIEIQKIKNHFI